MKTSVIFFICLISSIVVFGQNETKKINLNAEEVQSTSPKFTGVVNSVEMYSGERPQLINQFVAESFKCPLQSMLCGQEGTEVIRFTVTPAGRLIDFKVVHSVCPAVDKELIRVLKNTNGMWMPGYNDGEPIAMEHEVSMMLGDCGQDKIISHFVAQSVKYYCLGSSTLLVEQKPKKALQYFNKSIRYTPNDKGVLLLRGICSYELGKTEDAKRDWERIVYLGGLDYSVNYAELAEMKGYSEMTNILAKNNNK